MSDEIRDQLFEILAENSDQIQDPPSSDDDDYSIWVDDLHREAEEAASDFALRYRAAHDDSLNDEAATYHDNLAMLRRAIDDLGDNPEPEGVLEIHEGIRDLKFDIERLGEKCMIWAGETDNWKLRRTGETLAEEAERCWNPQAGNLIHRYLDEDRRDPSEEAPSLQEAVEESIEELHAARDDDIPYLMGKLDDARARLSD